MTLPSGTPPVQPGAPPTVARRLSAVALVLCALGLVALFLPLAEVMNGDLAVSVKDIPVLGTATLVLFLALTALPLLGFTRTRLGWTALLGVPVVLGAPLLALLLAATSNLQSFAGLAASFARLDAGVHVLEMGSGMVLLIVAEVGLAATVVLALVAMARARRSRTVVQTPPPPEPLHFGTDWPGGDPYPR